MIMIMARRACEKEKYHVIGVKFWLEKRRNVYVIKLSNQILQRAETDIYRIWCTDSFVREHYMEELIIRNSDWKKSVRIEKKILFQKELI